MIRPLDYARGDIKHLTTAYGGASPQGEAKSNEIICHIERKVVKSKYLM